MNGPEHYKQAEQHLGWSAEVIGDENTEAAGWHQKQAQAHATLALAAATALGRESGMGTMPGREREQWFDCAATPKLTEMRQS